MGSVPKISFIRIDFGRVQRWYLANFFLDFAYQWTIKKEGIFEVKKVPELGHILFSYFNKKGATSIEQPGLFISALTSIFWDFLSALPVEAYLIYG